MAEGVDYGICGAFQVRRERAGEKRLKRIQKSYFI
jgi:hypothetical protein